MENKHDFIRQKKGSFKKCCETLDVLKKILNENKKSKLSYNVNGVYTSENANDVIKTSEFFINNYKVPSHCVW